MKIFGFGGGGERTTGPRRGDELSLEENNKKVADDIARSVYHGSDNAMHRMAVLKYLSENHPGVRLENSPELINEVSAAMAKSNEDDFFGEDMK